MTITPLFLAFKHCFANLSKSSMSVNQGKYDGGKGATRRYLVSYSLSELLVNVAALMEHHSKQLLDFTENKSSLSLDQRITAASYIKICEQLVLRIQATIRNAEILG